MAEELDELLQFLCDDRPEVKKLAVDIVKGLTGSSDGLVKLQSKATTLLPLLLRLTNDDSRDVSEGSCAALVNLSQDKDIVRKLLQFGVVDRVNDYIRENSCQHLGLLMMLLSNVTQPDEGAKAMLQLGKGNLEGLHMARLMGLFFGRGAADGAEDRMEHFAHVLTNVTQLPEGRKLLLAPGSGLLKAMIGQLDPKCSSTRRIGCANAIRNCLYSCRADGTLEHALEAEASFPDLLRPISGEEPKEPEDSVRCAVAEAALMLAAEESGREALLKHDAHMVLKKGYEFEECAEVCEAMERAAVIFMTKGEVEPDGEEAAGAGDPGQAAGDREVECTVLPGGFSLG